MTRRGLLLAWILAVGSGGALADEPKPSGPPGPPKEKPAKRAADTAAAAAEAVAAVKAGDAPALARVAGRDVPDPWVVADVLLATGEADVAEAFAKAAPRPDVERLPAYVAARQGVPSDADARQAFAQAVEAVGRADYAVTLRVLAPVGAGDDDVVGTRILFARGVAFQGTSQHDAAERAFLAAADRAERLGWLATEARALEAAAASAHATKDLAGALAHSERRVAVEERRGLLAERGRALHGLAGVLRERGEDAKALEVQRRAIVVLEGAGVPALLASAINEAGVLEQRLGELDAARGHLERAIAAFEALGDAPNVARVVGNLGIVHASAGEYDEARRVFERALRMQEGLGDLPGVASALDHLGNVAELLGDLEKAIEYHARSLEIRRRSGDRLGIAQALANLGSAHQAAGSHAKAIAVLEEALASFEEIGDRYRIAAVVENLGVAWQSVGDAEKARALHDRARRLFKEIGDRQDEAVALTNLGNLEESLGRHERAVELLGQALALAERMGDRARVATVLGNLGAVRTAQGRWAEALALCERALREKEALGDAVGVAHVLGNLSDVRLGMGDPDGALATRERAVARSREIGARAVLAGNLRGLAWLRLARGEPREAATAARQAVEEAAAVESGLGDEASALARGVFAAAAANGLRAAVSLDDAAEAFFFLESGRAGALLESLDARRTIHSEAVPEALRKAEAGARSKVTAAVSAQRRALDGGDLDRIRTAAADLRAARAAVADVVERIQREAKAAASLLYPRPDDLAAVRGRLGAGEALVLYGSGGDEAVALVVTVDRARIVRLGRADAVAAACAAAACDDAGRDPAAGLAALRAAVVEPLGLPAGLRRVLVSPDGALSYAPIAALLEDREVAYVPSGTTHGLLLESAGLRGEGVLALGDPDYATSGDARAVAVARGGWSLAPLPATREEAEAVGTQVLLGARASATGLRDALRGRPRWRAVHLACHGLIDRERPAFSALALAPAAGDDGFLMALDVFRARIPADLVVLSACETGKGKDYEGEGIFGLMRAFMFAGAPRVVASLWKVDDEATRALMVKFYALWNPKDGSTPLGAASALRAAQAHVRGLEVERVDEAASQAAGHEVRAKIRPWAHPYYWAAWVLWGLPD